MQFYRQLKSLPPSTSLRPVVSTTKPPAWYDHLVGDVTPLVSVLVPIYNHSQFVTSCLNSVLASGYSNIELLMVDDGSVDDSYSIAQKWIRAHGSKLAHVTLSWQANRGITYTLNRLVHKAKGKYVTLLASDDYLLPGGIASRVAALELHGEWQAVFADCTVVDEAGQVVLQSGLRDLHRAYIPALLHPRFLARELVIRWSVPGPVFMARRQVFDEETGIGGYDVSLAVEDRDYYLRLLHKGLLGFIDTKVAGYRIVGNSASRDVASRPMHLRSLALTEKKNLHRFRGLSRIALHLRRYIYECMLQQARSRLPIASFLVRCLYRMLSITYFLHRLDFALRGRRPKTGRRNLERGPNHK